MRKPISKHALRRALEQVRKDGFLAWEHPVGTVVDRIWHELGKSSYNGSRKKPVARESVRTAPVLEADPEA
jgi:hypothetical protein